MHLTLQKFEATGAAIPGVHFEVAVQGVHPQGVVCAGYAPTIHLAGVEVPAGGYVPDSRHLSASSYNGLTMRATLPHHVVTAIEKNRAGGDVSLSLHLNFQTQENTGRLGNSSASLDGPRSLSIKEWQKILEKIGYANRRTIEIDVPTLPTFEGMERVVHWLEAGLKTVQHGDPDDALIDARKAMEYLQPLVAKKVDGVYVMDSRVADFVDRTSHPASGRKKKSQVMESQRQALWEALHMGAHEGYRVHRADAEQLVHATVDLVTWYATMLARVAEAAKQGSP